MRMACYPGLPVLARIFSATAAANAIARVSATGLCIAYRHIPIGENEPPSIRDLAYRIGWYHWWGFLG